MTKQVAIITIPNRKIVAGEYGASYGCNTTHMEIFDQYIKLPKSASMWTVYTEGNIEINVEYTSKTLGKRNMEEINLFIEKGFILEANIDGVELVQPKVEQAVDVVEPDFTSTSTDTLITESKSLTDSRLMWLNGYISLTNEQVAEIDARGKAVAAELAKRYAPADGKYHDPQYPTVAPQATEVVEVVESEQAKPAPYVSCLDKWINENASENFDYYQNQAPELQEAAEDNWLSYSDEETQPDQEEKHMDTRFELPIYEKNDGYYCQDCKPRGGTPGTLVVSSYTPCCKGCGWSFREIAEAREEEISPTEAAELQSLLDGPRVGPFTFDELVHLVRPDTEHPYESGSLDRPDTIKPSSKIVRQVPCVLVLGEE